MSLPRGSALTINSVEWTEHNRDSLNVDETRIERSERMVGGTLRKNHVADKHRISASWSMLVSATAFDGKLAGKGMKDFYESSTGKGSFPVVLAYDGTKQSFTMSFSSWSYQVVKRSGAGYDLVNVSIELEEV